MTVILRFIPGPQGLCRLVVPRSRLRSTVAVVCLISALVSGSVARAQVSPESLIMEGIEMRRKGQNAKAHGYFKRAYELSPMPRAAAQLGLVEQAIGRFVDAERYLSEALTGDDAWVEEHRSVLEHSRELVRKQLGQLVTRGLPPGASFAVTGRPAAALPANGIIWLSPGTTVVVFAAPGFASVTKTVTLTAGKIVDAIVELPAATTAPGSSTGDAVVQKATPSTPVAQAKPVALNDERASQPVSSMRVASYVVGGAGIAALGVGTVFGLRTVARWSERNAHCPGSDANCDATAVSSANQAMSASTIADVGFGVGVVAVATGVYLWLHSGSSGPSTTASGEASRLAITPALGSGAGSVTVTAHW